MAHSFKEKCLGNGCWITYIIPLKVNIWQKHWLLLKAVWFFWMINKNDILEIGSFLKKTRKKSPKIVGIFVWKFWKKNVFSLLLWKNKHLKQSISKKERKGVGVISWEWLYDRKLEKEISKLTLVEMKTSKRISDFYFF